MATPVDTNMKEAHQLGMVCLLILYYIYKCIVKSVVHVLMLFLPLPGSLGSDWLGLAWLSSLSGSPGLHTPTVFVYLLQVVYAYSVSPITGPLLHH